MTEALAYAALFFLIAHLVADIGNVARMRHHARDWWTLMGIAALVGHLALDFIA